LRLRQTEVEDLDQPVFGHHHVLGLQIPVHDTRLVRPRQSVGDLSRDLEQPLHRQRAGEQHFPQRLPRDHLHRDVGDRLHRPDVVDRDDVGVVQGRCRPGLLLETLQTQRIRGHFRRQHLDRHVAREPRIPRPIHLSHPARAKRREHLVRTQARARSEGHGKL
jgi:hypothetical protein